MPKVMWAPMGKLEPQIPRVINFAYELHFRHVIAHWKGIFKKYTISSSSHSIYNLTSKTKKHYLGPQNDPRST